METPKKELTFIVLRENAFQSALADIFTFGVILFSLWFNHAQLGGKWYMDVAFIILGLLNASIYSRSKKFYNLKDAKEYINNLK